MLVKYFILAIFIFVLFINNLSAQNETTPKSITQEPVQSDTVKYQNISVPQFKEMMNKEDIIILDVRTVEETSTKTIDGAITIDVLDAIFENEIHKLDKSKTYLVYCRSGRRSVKACNIMADSGFKNLYNLIGGYIAWSE